MFTVNFELVHGPGDSSRRALKCELHSR
jgi:hypothetical protein